MNSLVWLSAMGVPAFEQDDIDSVKADPEHHQLVLENEQVRIVRWVVPARDKTLNHSHPNSLNINLTDYNGRVKTPDGKTVDVHDKAGSLKWRLAGIHAVENIGSQRMEGLIVEPKKPASARPAGSADPATADPKHQKVEFENEMIRVIRESYAARERFVMHGHPDNVQVLLTDVSAEITGPEGETATIMGRAGEVRWRPVTQHSGRILDKPVEQIVIEMKGTPRPGTSLK